MELAVVTGRGEPVSCSPARNPRLFDAVRAGLGQVAVITRATLSLVPAPRTVRRFLPVYPDLATMLGDQRLLVREPRFEVVQGAVLAAPAGGWRFRLEVVKELSGSPPGDGELLAGLADDRPMAQASTLPYLDYLDRLAALEQALRVNGQWWFPHPWLTTFVGDAAVEPVVAGELAELGRPTWGRSGSRSAPSPCPGPTGAATSGRRSARSARPRTSTSPAGCSRPATRSSEHGRPRRFSRRSSGGGDPIPRRCGWWGWPRRRG